MLSPTAWNQLRPRLWARVPYFVWQSPGQPSSRSVRILTRIGVSWSYMSTLERMVRLDAWHSDADLRSNRVLAVLRRKRATAQLRRDADGALRRNRAA